MCQKNDKRYERVILGNEMDIKRNEWSEKFCIQYEYL